MSIQSMTGFARGEGAFKSLSWVWEVRSVNGKGLDARVRLPSGFEELDNPVRTKLAEYFKRGNFHANLQISSHEENIRPRVNEQLALQLFEAASSLQEKIGGELPDISQIMTMRGVVELEEAGLGPEERKQRDAAIMGSLETVLGDLQKARMEEGAAISKVLLGQVQTLTGLTEKIDSNEERSSAAIADRLSAQVAKLVDAAQGLDEQRLHQEAVILAAKADIQEELDRLNVHLASARDLLNGSGPIGRKLDFLAQEFNRECNTICSKSNSAAVTSLGLDIKLVIDQFREQVQNME